MKALKVGKLLAVVAFVAAGTSSVFAQSRDVRPSDDQGVSVPRNGMSDNSAMGRSNASGGLNNSTNRLENGTASNKGSGPGAGSPNGN